MSSSDLHTVASTSVQRRDERPGPGDEDGGMGFGEVIFFAGSALLVLLFFPLSLVVAIKVIHEYERAVIFRLGRITTKEAKGPGLIFVMPCIDELRTYDLRTKSSDIRPQKVLTKDSMSVTIDAVVFSRVVHVTRGLMYVTDPHHSTRLLAATTLRRFAGKKTLQELLSDRRSLSVNIKKILDKRSAGWGVKVEKVDLKDIKMPKDMQRAMAAEAETERKAKAKVIAADGEMRASHALKEAADVIGQSPAAVKLRCLQTLINVSKKNSSTVVLPVPANLLSHWLKK